MNKLHFLADGEDHLVHYVSVVTSGKYAGTLQMTFKCCAKIIRVSPEDFAMGYSVRPHETASTH